MRRRGMCVPDAHKEGRPPVARPGGPALLLAFGVSAVAIFALTLDERVASVLLAACVAGAVGLLDDMRTLSGPVKVGLLLAASLPILLLQTYNPHPVLPFVGHLRLTVIYPLLVLIAIPVTSNTFNMVDVFNGLVSGFAAIASIPLLLAFVVMGDWTMVAVTAALFLALAGFYPFHRNPARIFPGDSGSLAIGAAYGAIAIVGRVEIVGVVALIPAVLNSFFVLSTIRGFIEHRRIKKRPVKLTPDFKLEASREKDAPMTLTRMMLAAGPLPEGAIVSSFLILEAFAALLACTTFAMVWWS